MQKIRFYIFNDFWDNMSAYGWRENDNNDKANILLDKEELIRQMQWRLQDEREERLNACKQIDKDAQEVSVYI